MTKKIAYRTRNWKHYNRSLINRGNLTIWFSEDAVKSWHQKPCKNRTRGRSFVYSDTYIELALTMALLQKSQNCYYVFLIDSREHDMTVKKFKNTEKPFKWKHFKGDIIVWLVRWYGRHALSYNDTGIQTLAENNLAGIRIQNFV